MYKYSDSGTPMRNVHGFYSYYRPLTVTASSADAVNCSNLTDFANSGKHG